MIPDVPLVVDDRDLRRAFRVAARQGIPASLKDTHHAIGEAVIRSVRPKLPKRSGDYAATLRASNTSWKALVRAGYKRRAPYAPIVHWGGGVPIRGGRPQIAEEAVAMLPELVEMYARGLDGELRKISAT